MRPDNVILVEVQVVLNRAILKAVHHFNHLGFCRVDVSGDFWDLAESCQEVIIGMTSEVCIFKRNVYADVNWSLEVFVFGLSQ